MGFRGVGYYRGIIANTILRVQENRQGSGSLRAPVRAICRTPSKVLTLVRHKHPPSPTWHRSLRRRRALSRARIRQAKRRGQPPRWRDLRRVHSHHAGPQPYQGVMGRGQKWEEWPQSSYSAPQWQLWRGSWPKNQKPVEDTKTLAFPHYDAGARPKGVSKGAHKGKHGWDTTEDYTTQPGEPWGKDLQDGLNQARKAEQRVRQLASTREAKVLQWQRYQEGLKRSFMQERLRHQKDIDKISEDLALAMQNQELAREQIVQIVDKAKTGYSGRQEMEDAQNAEWEQMKGDWMQEYAELDTPEAVIQRAMAARSRQAPSTEQLSARPPPGLHSYQAPGPTPADPGDPFMSAMGAPNLGAPRPPYQGSPGQHARTVPSPGSGQRRSSLPTGQRQPVKQRPPLQAANPSGPPLGDKLMAKREADTWKLDDPVRPHHTTGPPLEAPTMAPIVEPGVPGPEMVDGNGPHAGLLGQTIPTGPGPGEVHIIEADEETDHELMEVREHPNVE